MPGTDGGRLACRVCATGRISSCTDALSIPRALGQDPVGRPVVASGGDRGDQGDGAEYPAAPDKRDGHIGDRLHLPSSGGSGPGEGRGHRLEAGQRFEEDRPLELGLLPLGHVDDPAAEARYPAGGIGVAVAPTLDPPHRAVGACEAVLQVVVATFGRDPGRLVEHDGPAVGMDERRPLLERGRSPGVEPGELHHVACWGRAERIKTWLRPPGVPSIRKFLVKFQHLGAPLSVTWDGPE